MLISRWGFLFLLGVSLGFHLVVVLFLRNCLHILIVTQALFLQLSNFLQPFEYKFHLYFSKAESLKDDYVGNRSRGVDIVKSFNFESVLILNSMVYSLRYCIASDRI